MDGSESNSLTKVIVEAVKKAGGYEDYSIATKRLLLEQVSVCILNFFIIYEFKTSTISIIDGACVLLVF